MSKIKIKAIFFLILILASLSLSLFIIEQVIFLIVPRTDFSDHMATMTAMVIMTSLVLVLSQKLKINFSIFPIKFTALYISASIITGILLVINPTNYTDGIKSIFFLVYSCIVTPVFEELIFRGYVWNKLNEVFSKEWVTYVVTTVLFALWHIGYISSIAFRVEDGLLNVMTWKVIVGICFGIVLGAVRLKTKNCYSTMLMHCIMNMFGR